jgi:hypothetical protein
MTGQGLGPVLSGTLADQFGSGLTITLLGVAVLIAAIPLARLPRVVRS